MIGDAGMTVMVGYVVACLICGCVGYAIGKARCE
jgi:hypothetical protein